MQVILKIITSETTEIIRISSLQEMGVKFSELYERKPQGAKCIVLQELCLHLNKPTL